ncbi:MAG: hypothetical protein GY940_26230 [bacterium]|nr:hypothetical protein [bacterium]
MHHFAMFCYQLGFVAASLVVAYLCYSILPDSWAEGTVWNFKVGGGLAAFGFIYWLINNRYNKLLSLPTTNLKSIDKSNSTFRTSEIHMITIGQEFTQVIWDNLITNSTKVIDIFFIYSSTWLNSHFSVLSKFLAKANRETNFFLLNPESTAADALQQKFDKSGETSLSLGENINQSISKIKSIANEKDNSNGKIRIYLQDFPPAYSAYRFDDKIVIVNYNQRPGRTNEIPAFLYNSKENKGLFDHYVNDIENFKGPDGHGTNYCKLHWETP